MAGNTSAQGKAGYKKGAGRTFTPSLKADWVEEFNRILQEDPGWSRNQLTEHYIQKGMVEESDDAHSTIKVPHGHLTEEQIAFLQTEEGRTFIGNVISYVLAGAGQGGIAPPQPVTSPPPAYEKQTKNPPPPKEKEEEIQGNKSPQPVESAKAEQKNTDKERSSSSSLSVMEKAQQKLNRQNL